jgi:hypothetical protein
MPQNSIKIFIIYLASNLSREKYIVLQNSEFCLVGILQLLPPYFTMSKEIEEVSAESGRGAANVHIRALVPFSAQTARDFAQVVSSASF